jgi:enoyl-CoA hydratase
MGFIQLEQRGHVAILTVNRPEVLNALNGQVLRDLEEAVDQVEANEEIYVAVLTGAGRAFVAGADISYQLGLTPVDAKAFSDYNHQVLFKLENMQKPVIAAINGFALGGGCELSMACDIRIASEKAKFGQPEVGLGITPGSGGTQRLPRIVGLSQAMELALTGKMIGAQEAKEIGLVSRVVPHEQLMDTVLELAETIASQPQVAVRLIKQCINRGVQTDIQTAATYESMAYSICCSTEDKHDAMAAFVEKRKLDHFKNR